MENRDRGMTLIVKTVTRLTAGLIMIYGIFTVLKEHSSPGGGFAGGVIIALAFINLVLAFGKDQIAERIDERKGLIALTTGALVFLILSTFSFLGLRISTLPLFCDIAVMLMVSAGLYLAFLILITLISKRERR
ncbi:MAG: MnhB domain-containing protein [Candidatus Omnitrophota bacterium]|jgi:multicomponent Na+:H+ antiporter subunit B